jgi:hypothetical protein
MKTRIILLLQAFVLAAVSCSDKLTDQSTWDNGVMASIPGYEDTHATRVRFNNGLDVFYWTNGDCIGVCRNAGSANGTAAFTLLKGGETIGNFINDAFSLLPNSEYYAFYPFEANTTASAFPINMQPQIQTANKDVNHIGSFNYMSSKFTTDESGKASFTFSNIGSVIQLHFTANAEETYQSLHITSSGSPFTIRANYNLTNGTYSSTQSNETFRVTFGENGMHVYNGEEVIISAVILPDDLSQSTLTFSLKNAAGAVVKELSFAGYAFSSGKLYHFYEEVHTGNPPFGGCPDGNHPHMIDLGLPSGTLWSCMNLGADKPIDNGIRFVWGQTDYVEKNTSNWANYEFLDSAFSDEWGISKYQIADDQTDGIWYNSGGSFVGDNKTTLDLNDDAARVNWGGKWRMPTKKEFDELLNYTKINYTANYNGNGTSGIIIYKKKANGQYSLWDTHIYLRVWESNNPSSPYIGYLAGHFWSSTLGQKTQRAYEFRPNKNNSYPTPEDSGTLDIYESSRIDKKHIRPVCSSSE